MSKSLLSTKAGQLHAAGNIRIRYNRFCAAQYGGVWFASSWRGDASNNSFDSMLDTCVYNESPLAYGTRGLQQRIVSNGSNNATFAPNTGPASFYASNTTEALIVGNSVANDALDGYSLAQWNNTVAIANSCYNANSNPGFNGDCSMQLNPSGNPPGNFALAFVGNNVYGPILAGTKIYSDPNTPAPGYITWSSLFANVYALKTSQAPALLLEYYTGSANDRHCLQDPNSPDINVLYGNVSWEERQHSAAPSSTNATLAKFQVPAGSLMDYNGLRFTAEGFTSGTATVTLSVTLANLTTSQVVFSKTWTPSSSSNNPWSLTLLLRNNGVSGQQLDEAQTTLGILAFVGQQGGLNTHTVTGSATVNTTSPQDPLVVTLSANASASLTCAASFIERC